MYLANIKLWNFRKYWGTSGNLNPSEPDLNLNFQEWLNVLIWENDSWKSAILDAIKLVLKTNTSEWIKVSHEDFYMNSKKIRIELTFKWLSINEASNFGEVLSINIEWEKEEYLLIFCEIERDYNKINYYDVKIWPEWEFWILKAEQRELLNVTYLKPLRDVKNELIPKKWSRLSYIFDSDIAFSDKENHILMQIFDKFNKSTENYFKWLNNSNETIEDQKWKELKNKIDKFVKEFMNNDESSRISVSKWELKNILEKLELSLENTYNPWLGSLNRLFIASELIHLQRSGHDGLILGLIEEIEAHIHPQAQLKIIESLNNHIENKGIQLIITTHSPNIASKVKLNNLIICCNNWAFPMGFSSGKEYTKLNKTDYKFLERFLDVTKSNFFFSDNLIFVEWWAEELILPSFAKLLKKLKIINKDLTEAQISVINVWNNSFFRYSKIFQRIDKPHMWKKVSIITDLDILPSDHIRKINDWTINNIIIKKSENNNIQQGINTFVSQFWTLEYCIWLFPKFQEWLLDSIKLAIKEQKDWTTYSRSEESRKLSEIWKTNEEIAYELYNWIILEKGVSKSIVGQYFSEFLEEQILEVENWTSKLKAEDFNENSSLYYLVSAIKYVIR